MQSGGLELTPGAAVDAMDEFYTWYTATIMDRSGDGSCVLVHFDGWESKWDEWMPVSTNRIEPLHSHTTSKTHGSKGGVKIPPEKGSRVEAKTGTGRGAFEPAVVVEASPDLYHDVEVGFENGEIHALRLSARQIRLPRLSPTNVDGKRYFSSAKGGWELILITDR